MKVEIFVRDIFTDARASVRYRVTRINIMKGDDMSKSTNYYIVHKTGRRLKVSCIGFMHDEKLRRSMLENVAKVEHGRPRDYRIEEEKENEHGHVHGRVATKHDYIQL